jgi:hypothetical protein
MILHHAAGKPDGRSDFSDRSEDFQADFILSCHGNLSFKTP